MALESGKATDRWLGKEASMDIGQPRSPLIRLSELDVPLEESWQDIRDLDVYDVADQQIGTVADLYVDRGARRPSYLVVSAGGLLGVGKKHFLVPVEEVSRDMGEERVRVTVPKEKVLNSPEFDLDVGTGWRPAAGHRGLLRASLTSPTSRGSGLSGMH